MPINQQGFNPLEPEIEGIPNNLGRYYLLDVIGRGGMAMVFRAFDRETQQLVAIKALQQSELEIDDDNTYNDTRIELIKRFRKEVGILSVLYHPNILSASDSGAQGEIVYVVMTLFEGSSLDRYLNRVPNKRLTLSHTAWLVKQLAAGLNYAHRRSVIHRDIKPANILLDFKENRAVLSDFGIAKLINTNNTQLTKTGTGVGTPGYMAPEQFLGKVGIASDIYALTAVAYRVLTGMLPFGGDDIFLIIEAQRSGSIASMASHGLAQFDLLDQVFARGLAYDQDQRYATAQEFARAFEEACQQIATRHNSSLTFQASPLPLIEGVGLAPLPTILTSNIPPAPPSPNYYAGTTPTPQPTPTPMPTPSNSFSISDYGRLPNNSDPANKAVTELANAPRNNQLLWAVIGMGGLIAVLIVALIVVVAISLGNNSKTKGDAAATDAANSAETSQAQVALTVGSLQTNAVNSVTAAAANNLATAQAIDAQATAIAVTIRAEQLGFTITALMANPTPSATPTPTP